MVKLTIQLKDNRQLVLLGLSAGNLRMLRDGNQIYLHGEQLGIQNDILVMFGATEEAIVADLRRQGVIPPDRQPDEPTEA